LTPSDKPLPVDLFDGLPEFVPLPAQPLLKTSRQVVLFALRENKVIIGKVTVFL
jgi:hypothetical protein